jgi:hypothetical protein
LIKGIDFPEALLRAQIAGELLVFAGAGVSHPAPTSLPLFRELAQVIGKDSGLERQDSEPEDRYLGRLSKRGVDVHEAAARILLNPQSKHHDLHRLLLQIFPSAKQIRLVTTNFDRHFSTAAEDLFGCEIETYYAPAIPLGNDFTGIIYLHGSAYKDAKRCVLTDEDFGRAYLTEAWASRFLAAMFTRYTVLFVGYSHNDIVMNYLARGLPPAGLKSRFAFTIAEGLERWHFLGIHPLTYKCCGGENPHQPITESINEWVREIRSGFLDKAQRIRLMAEAPPSPAGEDADYVKFALTEIETARIFLKYASIPEWIFWLEERGFLTSLFNPAAQLDSIEYELASWLAHFLPEHTEQLLELVEQNGGQLHASVCRFLWLRLLKRNSLAENIFSQWVTILIGQSHDILQSDEWEMLLAECRYPNDKAASLLLFDRITKPRVVLKKTLAFSENTVEYLEKVTFDLSLAISSGHWLTHAWQQLFSPNLLNYAAELEAIIASNLVGAYNILEACGKASRNYDPFQFHRQSIEPHAQNGSSQVVDILIDGGRDILKLFLVSNLRLAVSLMTGWFASEVPILRRLAIVGFAQRGDWSFDEKLAWLVEHGLIYQFKTDVFWFLQQVYPSATETARKSFLNSALVGPSGEAFASLEARSKAYMVYNLLVWLAGAAPNCSLVSAALNQIKDEYPDFQLREHPELEHWTSGATWMDPIAGFDIDEIGTNPPDRFLDELLAARPADPFEKDRSRYCSAISAAVGKLPKWGMDLAQTLISRGLQDRDLWLSICFGWSRASLSPEEWQLVLDLAETIDAPPDFFEGFVEVLARSALREEHRIPSELIEKSQSVAERVWIRALESSMPEHDEAEWFDSAINQPGGKLVEFWLWSISVVREVARDSWGGIPTRIKNNVLRILKGSSGASGYARAIFAGWIHYLFSLDASFSQERLLPLFDWQASESAAEQCWNGFLRAGRWLPGLLPGLLPFFNATVAKIESFPERIQKALVTHIAILALYFMEDPFIDDWLPQIANKLGDENLIRLAEAIDRFLDDMHMERGETKWERWLLRYWELRRIGIPRILSPQEGDRLACWALSVGKHYPEAVEIIKSTPLGAAFGHTAFFYRLRKKELATAYPQATAELVLVCLKASRDRCANSGQLAELWSDLRQKKLSAATVDAIRSEALRLGIELGAP